MPKWQAIFKDNFHKSLDHRSFYWKQNEKKGMMPKLLVQELRDAAEKRRSERVAVLLALTGRCDFGQRLCAHLSLDYDDVGVHADTSAILQMGVDNMLTADAAAKVRAVYHAFMETFFETACTCVAAEERRRAAAARAAADGQPLSPRSAMRRMPKKPAPPEAEAAPADDEAAGLRALTGMAAADEGPATEAESSDSEVEEEPAGAAAAAAGGGDEAMGEEEADESEFVNCRPVVPVVAGGGAAPPAPTASPGPDGLLHPHCRIFYGNEGLYVFFRLHHLLYERVRFVRQCAAERGAEAGAGPGWTPAAAAVHADYMLLVEALIDGRTDPSTYEDDCRALLGTNAYQLFTVDKLVQKVVKQAQACLADDPAARLVELWRYENARAVPAVDAVYHANAHVVLGDEACFRFEHTAGRRVEVQLMDADKADTSPPILEPAFREYVAEYVDSEGARAGRVASELAEAAAARVCLRRNLAAAARGAALEPAAEAALEGAALVNGLECKLGSSTQQRVKKIAYVLGTEDYYHRRGGARGGGGAKAGGAALAATRAAKFRGWLDAQEPPAAAAAAAAVPAEVQAAA